MRDDERDLIATLDRPLPGTFHRREVVVRPDRPQVLDGPEWTDVMVVVASGDLEVTTPDGRTARFGPGSVLAFARTEPPTVRGCDGEQSVLVVVGRRRQ